eukprot:g11581.t1
MKYVGQSWGVRTFADHHCSVLLAGLLRSALDGLRLRLGLGGHALLSERGGAASTAGVLRGAVRAGHCHGDAPFIAPQSFAAGIGRRGWAFGRLGYLALAGGRGALCLCRSAVDPVALGSRVSEVAHAARHPDELLMARLGRPGARERLHRVKTLRQEDLANIEDLHAEDLANIEDLDAEEPRSLWVEKHRMAGTPLYTASSGVGEQEEDVQRQRTCRLLWRTFGDAKDILLGRIPGARQGLLLALAAAVLNQACASTSILIYAQKLLSDVGVRSQVEQDLQSCILIAAKLLGVTLGASMNESCSPRDAARAALCGRPGLFGVADLADGGTGMGLFVLFFFSTWGVGYWSVVVEVTAVGGPRYASCAQALATATLFGTGWLTSLTFLKVMSLGGYGLLVYVTVAVLMCVYALVWLPETSGHSLEECAHDVEVQAHVNLEDSCAVSTSDSEYPRSVVSAEGIAKASQPPDVVNGVQLTRGALGLILSYHTLLKRIAEGDQERRESVYLVAEDDAVFAADLLERLRAAVQALQREDARWEFLHVGYYDDDCSLAPLASEARLYLCRPIQVYGLFGAVLRPAGARRLLEASSLEPAVRFGLGLLESS